MITIENVTNLYRGEPITLYGLSTDTKPTDYLKYSIPNGSVFVTIDTGAIYMYDAEHSEWHEI